MVKLYYASNPFTYSVSKNYELEAKFGTRGIKPLTKIDYDNVIKKLKSSGFVCNDENGIYRLSMQTEYLDKNTGTFKLSSIRTEISGFREIQEYCKHNDIQELIKQNSVNVVSFTKKEPILTGNREKLFPVNFDDFNFRVALQIENIQLPASQFIVKNWLKSKKTFRYINRVTFKHPDYPINVDISISKQTDYEGKEAKKYYTTSESGIFTKRERYEIELEVNNKEVGPGTKFNTYKSILDSLRKVIKLVLSGLQGTNFPISYPEQKDVLKYYMTMLYKEQSQIKNQPIYEARNSNFIGPNSYTLQMSNISPIDENSNIPNIRKDFVVTDKADGERHLMIVNEIGKIYLINTNMNVIFTGAKTEDKKIFNSIVDGELILHDKYGKFINLYMAFDIYYYNKLDVRALTFMLQEKEKDANKSRYYILNSFITALKPISIMDTGSKQANPSVKSLVEKLRKSSDFICPIRIQCKKFYPQVVEKGNIFTACRDILEKTFEYETDGLILTHAFYGVGSNEIGKAGPLAKVTWEYSFKWKPPKYNTIDFLVRTIKTPTGDDVIKPIFEDGINVLLASQLNEYKMIELNCSFSQSRDGFINPCQDIIDDVLPEYKPRFEDKRRSDVEPQRFYPTSPYDINAGICKMMLRHDDNGVKQMFSLEDQVFQDNTIVEFSYDFSREEGWRWVPLRVRYDKTAELRQGNSQYGNAYYVANSNWQSIHNPITEEMISSGINLPDISVDEDIYYNKTSGNFKTDNMKNFHNLYVKKTLIKSVSKKGDTLIDYACGKGGDLPKWINSQLSFVFGVDLSKDNLENKLDGACARFLNLRKENKHMPYALFVNGNSAYNIKNGSAMLNEKAVQITKAVFGQGPKDEKTIGKGVVRQYGKAQEGFNISSCQFALHYLLKNPDTLQGFLRNLSECTKLGGYFIGTAYDGKTIFNLLKKKQTGESVQIVEDGKKIWEIVKAYRSDTFEDNSSSLGYRIDVYQESINQLISEYLVNFDYLDRVMENFGFKVIDRNEAKELGLPEGSGLFSELFLEMLDEIKKNKFKANDYKSAPNMSEYEKKISFLNRYFVYKKFRNVNEDKVELELSEYNEDEMDVNHVETQKAVKEAEREVSKIKPKIRKLNKKILLVGATEAFDEVAKEPEIASTKKKIKKTKTKLLIIEEDEE